jgi:hypothetical protein
MGKDAGDRRLGPCVGQRISASTIYALLRSGLLPGFQATPIDNWRIHRDDLDNFSNRAAVAMTLAISVDFSVLLRLARSFCDTRSRLEYGQRIALLFK